MGFSAADQTKTFVRCLYFKSNSGNKLYSTTTEANGTNEQYQDSPIFHCYVVNLDFESSENHKSFNLSARTPIRIKFDSSLKIWITFFFQPYNIH